MCFEEKLKDLLASIGDHDERTRARLDLNNFFQERIETIRTRLWTALTWLAAVQGAALVLAIKQGGLQTEPGPKLLLDQPILIFLLGFLSALLAYYMRQVHHDGVKHIQSNQELSNIAVELTPRSSSESVFDVMRTLANVALFIESVLTLVGILGILVWLGADIPLIQITPGTQAASDG